MLSIILFTLVGLYLIELIILRIGLWKSDQPQQNMDYEPIVSIIVAARNEEEYISACIRSLQKIDYPVEKLDIIIVNDSSTDRTPEIVKSFTTSDSCIRMISTSMGKGNLRGKTNAIAQGMEIAKGEIVLFTDADCQVPPTWVKGTIKYFDKNVGIVGGFTLLKGERAFEVIQSLDWLFLFGLASSTAGLKIPLTVIGNNLAVRMRAYQDVGGYENIPFSVTEDCALVQAVIQRTKYKVRFPIEIGNLVQSYACRDWGQLYRQKQRWGVGGTDMVFHGYLVMLFGWLAKVSILISIIEIDLLTVAGAFVIMSFGEIGLLWKLLRRFRVLGHIRYSLLFNIYLFVYVLVIPFVAFFSRNVVWKNRTLT
jgi:cellulose synthase/poly-beta-1,6-N-acetylglucosamine synthase-like glycosyltransferase